MCCGSRVSHEHGHPALLENRRHRRLGNAIALWKQLRSFGWEQTAAGRGTDAGVQATDWGFALILRRAQPF